MGSTSADYWKLRLLTHTHDTFKAQAIVGASIDDPASHASLARAFLAEFCNDSDLLAMLQYHDEPFALWRQVEANEKHNAERFARLLNSIKDWNLFLTFTIIDGCTEGKSRDPLRWFLREVCGKVKSGVTTDDIL